MASVKDVAAYILSTAGEMTAMKLQKLAYYSKAWHLVWEESAMFPQHFEAWANGPVSPVLYREHRGKFMIAPGEICGDPESLSSGEKESIDSVVSFYRQFTATQLSELTHSEAPWKDARADSEPGDRSKEPITDAAMAEFYEGLAAYRH